MLGGNKYEKIVLLLVAIVLSVTLMATFCYAGEAFDSNIVLDFEDVEVDYDIFNNVDNYFRDYWVCKGSKAATIKATAGGNKYIDFSSFQWTYYDYDQSDDERELAESYTFKFDIMGATTAATAVGATIRGSYESAINSIPTYDDSGSKKIPWSENDGSGKDSGNTDGSDNTDDPGHTETGDFGMISLVVAAVSAVAIKRKSKR